MLTQESRCDVHERIPSIVRCFGEAEVQQGADKDAAVAGVVQEVRMRRRAASALPLGIERPAAAAALLLGIERPAAAACMGMRPAAGGRRITEVERRPAVCLVECGSVLC